MRKSKTYIATPPGESVKEQLIDKGMSQKEFALRMGMSEKHISRFINGDVLLTQDMAYRLEMVLGVPASFWNKLESIYREKLQLVKEENDMDEDKKILDYFSYDEMAKLRWVDASDDVSSRIISLRKFFRVARLSLIKEPLFPCFDNDYDLLAYANKARLLAYEVNTGPINEKIIKDNLNDYEILKQAGVVIVSLPCFKNIKSVSFKDSNKLIIGISDVKNKEQLILKELNHLINLC